MFQSAGRSRRALLLGLLLSFDDQMPGNRECSCQLRIVDSCSTELLNQCVSVVTNPLPGVLNGLTALPKRLLLGHFIVALI